MWASDGRWNTLQPSSSPVYCPTRFWPPAQSRRFWWFTFRLTQSAILKVLLCFQASEHGRPIPVPEVPAGFSVLPGSDALAKTGGIPRVSYLVGQKTRLVWSPLGSRLGLLVLALISSHCSRKSSWICFYWRSHIGLCVRSRGCARQALASCRVSSYAP